MAQIVEVDAEGKSVIRHVPGKSRIIDELKRVFPGARFVNADLTPTGGDKRVPCLELRYNPPAPAKGDASICAVPLGETENDRNLAPLALMRHALRRLGYQYAVTEIVSKTSPHRTKSRRAEQLDRIWRFTYSPIPVETKADHAEQNSPAAPEKKESEADGREADRQHEQ